MNNKLHEAITLVWKSDFVGAENILRSCLSKSSYSPDASLHFAEIGWLRAVLSEDDEHANDAYERIENCIKICSKEKDILYKSIQGECIILKSLLSLRLGSYVSGAYYLRKGWLIINNLKSKSNEKSFNEASKETQQRILLIVSSFHFFVSIIPSSIRFIVSALGFEANRKDGYNEIKQCFESQSSLSPFAGVILLWIESFFTENLHQAGVIFQQCMDLYPNNILILYLGGYLSRQKFSIEEAIPLFEKAQSSTLDFTQFKISCDYELGDCYWKLMKWDNAIKFLNLFQEENKSKSFRCFGAYQLGIAYCFINDEEKALEWFKKSQKWARKYFSFDSFAARKSKEYSKSKPMMDDIEKHLISAGNLRKQGKQEEALELLTNINIEKEIGENNEQLSTFYYIIGRLYKETNNFEKALENFNLCINLQKKVKQEIYTIPHSLMEKGDVLLRQGNNTDAISCLLEAKKFKSYDFDKPNSRRIMRLLDQSKNDSFLGNNIEFSANE